MGILFVGGDEVFAGDAVLVGEDEVLALGSDECLVKNARLLEAVVLVPHMLDGQPVAETLYQLTGVVARAIVGDDNFVGGTCLVKITPKGLF